MEKSEDGDYRFTGRNRLKRGTNSRRLAVVMNLFRRCCCHGGTEQVEVEG